MIVWAILALAVAVVLLWLPLYLRRLRGPVLPPVEVKPMTWALSATSYPSLLPMNWEYLSQYREAIDWLEARRAPDPDDWWDERWHGRPAHE